MDGAVEEFAAEEFHGDDELHEERAVAPTFGAELEDPVEEFGAAVDAVEFDAVGVEVLWAVEDFDGSSAEVDFDVGVFWVWVFTVFPGLVFLFEFGYQFSDAGHVFGIGQFGFHGVTGFGC